MTSRSAGLRDQARRGRGRSEDPLAPVSPVFVVPGGAVEPREDKRFFVRTSALQAPTFEDRPRAERGVARTEAVSSSSP